MFMRQKWNESARLIRITSHGPFIRSDQFKLPRGASSLEQMRLLGHVNTKQRCETQSVWNDWTPAGQEKHCVQRRDSQKAFQSAHTHGFTVVTLTALWYCGRNVGYSHLILLQE